MFIVFSINGDSHSDSERMKSMFEEALLRHPENTLESPAETFYNNFETFRPFAVALKDKYMSEKGYRNELEFKKRDELAWIMGFSFGTVSEVIIGEIISHHEDTIYNEIYKSRCPLGNEFIIRVDTVLMGNINKGEIITTRARGGKHHHSYSNLSDYPYMKGDTVLVFLHHFPSTRRCRHIWNDHKNDIGYRMPFYEVGVMFQVTSLYITKDSPSGKVNTVTGPVHVTYHELPDLWFKPFDYPITEVKQTLSKFIKQYKEWQDKWYNYVNPQIMDSIVLEQFNSERAINSIIWW